MIYVSCHCITLLPGLVIAVFWISVCVCVYMCFFPCRGFGFVTFADAGSVDKVLAQPHHELDSKTVCLVKRSCFKLLANVCDSAHHHLGKPSPCLQAAISSPLCGSSVTLYYCHLDGKMHSRVITNRMPQSPGSSCAREIQPLSVSFQPLALYNTVQTYCT